MMKLDEDIIEFFPEGEEGSEDLNSNPEKYSDTVVYSTDWTTETLVTQLKKGNILLTPDFQRRNAWKNQQQSQFIESLFLWLPVPQIILAESRQNKNYLYLVIDGKQRLLSLRQFCADENDDEYEILTLKQLNILKEFNGKTYSHLKNQVLQQRFLEEFENRPIRTVVIKNWPDEDFIYEVFLRLNMGSVSISPQELRQALHPGHFIRYIDDFSQENRILKSILKLEKDKSDYRMRDAELVVRYFALRNFLTEYKGNIKDFLDKTCLSFNEAWKPALENDSDNKIVSQVEKQASDFNAALELTCQIFGDHAFKKWSESKYVRFNRAVFDIMVYYFSEESIRNTIVSNPTLQKALYQAFKRLCRDNPDFSNALEKDTKTRANLVKRLSAWGEVISDLLKISMPIPVLVENKIVLKNSS